MKTYPFSAPIILNDTIFTQYGGQTGSFTAAQRSAAYLIAETQTSNYIGTLLLPTVVTGTWGYAPNIVTDYGYVSQIYATNFLTLNSLATSVLTPNSGYALIWEDTYGYVDVYGLLGTCNCTGGSIPYQVQVVYQAGLPTGVASHPSVLLAMTMATQISLNEMIFSKPERIYG